MSYKSPHLPRRLSRQKTRFRVRAFKRIRYAVGIVLVGLLLCLLGVLATAHSSGTAQAAGGSVASRASGASGKRPPCDAVGKPNCPTQSDSTQWIAVSGESPSSVASAITQSVMFQSTETREGRLTLDTPALVHLIHSVGGSDYWTHDHWLASAANDNGQRVGVFDFVFDRANHRIRFAVFGSLSPSDPRYGKVFPYTSATFATQRLSAERGVEAKPGVPPMLVFFPPDPAILAPDSGLPQRTWTSGGEYPSDPMWLVPGNDGHNYYIGVDGHAHVDSDLPLAH